MTAAMVIESVNVGPGDGLDREMTSESWSLACIGGGRGQSLAERPLEEAQEI